jgi:hypothetical protein
VCHGDSGQKPLNHRENRERREYKAVIKLEETNRITESIIGSAIEVHRALGPGLLESAYETCLSFELVEVKAVEELAPIHQAQLISYLRLSGCQIGLLINFNVQLLKNGIKRVICKST